MFPVRKVILRSLVWLAIAVGGGLIVAFSTVKGSHPTPADVRRATSIGQVTAYVALAGLAVIILPEAYAVGQRKRSGGSTSSRKSSTTRDPRRRDRRS
ncbi:MAG: hypothetical protein U0794_06210 [Isosphaeraceae bacterium]